MIVILRSELCLKFTRAQIMFLNITLFHVNEKERLPLQSENMPQNCTSLSPLNQILSPLLILIVFSKYPFCLFVRRLFYFFSDHFRPTE